MKVIETKPEVGGASPLFIVRNVPATLAFYRDKLGFEVTFEGPEPDDIFFGIVQRGRAMIMFKAIDVEPVPNYTRDIGHGIAGGDAYIYVPDPDAFPAKVIVIVLGGLKETHISRGKLRGRCLRIGTQNIRLPPRAAASGGC